jgi:hypothetical protein
VISALRPSRSNTDIAHSFVAVTPV